MDRKLREQKGMAMVVVSCMMALLLIVCLSLLYGTAHVVVNVEKRYGQIQAYQLAKSLNDTIRDAVASEQSHVLPEGFLNIVWKFLEDDSFASETCYFAYLADDDLPESCHTVMISMEKSAFDVPPKYSEDALGWLECEENCPDWAFHTGLEPVEKKSSNGYLDIVVKVETTDSSATVRYHYDCMVNFSKENLAFYWKRDDGSLIELALQDDDSFIYGDGETLWYPDTGNPVLYEDVKTYGTVQTEDGSSITLYSAIQGDRIPFCLNCQGEI